MSENSVLGIPIDHLLEHIAKKHGKDADELKQRLQEALRQD